MFFSRIVFCACYAQNVWHAQNFPFLTQLLWYENGTQYQQLNILNDDFTLNYEKLEREGLPWYAASQLIYKISRTMYVGGREFPFFSVSSVAELTSFCSLDHAFLPLAWQDHVAYL